MKTATFQTGIIPPEAVAYKLAAWRNFKTPKFAEQAKALPRLAELVWFIQAQSMQPGGLDKFVLEFLAAFPDRLCTPSMHRYGKKAEPYTSEERKVIIYEVPRYYQSRPHAQATEIASAFWNEIEIWERGSSTPRPNMVRRSKLNYAEFADLCRKAALSHLEQHLATFCNCGIQPKDPYVRVEDNESKYGLHGDWTQDDCPLENVWYFQDLPGALMEMLDIHAARARGPLVMTEVAKKCFDGLEYAWSEKALVMIEGDTRFGKTQSVRTWAEMSPGQARWVRTPCSNCEFDLFQAIAESIGLEVTLKTTYRELKTRVEFVIRHGGLMFILDESHFLLPTHFSRNTPPGRLNWIRTRIVDQGCPLVLVSTPQDFKQCLDRFTRATGHNIDQFLGRMLWTIRLPGELKIADLRAVAKKHFPDLDDDYLDLIVAKAQQAESFLMAVESIAKLARFFARKACHDAVTLDDLEAAITETVPNILAPAPAAAAPPRPRPMAVKRSRPAAPPAPALEVRAREITPALQPPTRSTIPVLQTI
jgi:hypothetical protein